MTFFVGPGFAELQILKKWKWPYLLNWVEYCDEILHRHWYWHDLAHEIVKWHLELVEGLPRFKFWKKWNLTLKLFGIVWWNFADTLILTRSSSRNCKVTFISGRGFAELQILKKWKWPYLLNWVEYCDEILHTHWYWQDVPHKIVNDIWEWLSFCRGSNLQKSETIAKWQLSSVEALPSARFWIRENGPISRTEWNILIDFCKNIDIDKI